MHIKEESAIIGHSNEPRATIGQIYLQISVENHLRRKGMRVPISDGCLVDDEHVTVIDRTGSIANCGGRSDHTGCFESNLCLLVYVGALERRNDSMI